MLQEKLIEVLIGLARATEGNSHLMNEQVDQVVLEGIAHMITDTKEQPKKTDTLIQAVRRTKEYLVPDCATCAAPCGRTNDYDINLLWNAPDNIKKLKTELLTRLHTIVKNNGSVKYTEETMYFFYTVLFAVGSDWEENELNRVMKDLLSYS